MRSTPPELSFSSVQFDGSFRLSPRTDAEINPPSVPTYIESFIIEIAVISENDNPAGKFLKESLKLYLPANALYAKHREQITVIELNPKTARLARQLDLVVHMGDASHRVVLERAGVYAARVIAITIPDPDATRSIIQMCRVLNPTADIVVRSRYHVRRWELSLAGAHEVIDEEEQVGLRIAASARRFLANQDREKDDDTTDSD